MVPRPCRSSPSAHHCALHCADWQHRVGEGLSWYTALGHEVNMYLDEAYRQHFLGGLLTVTRHRRGHLPA